MIDNNDIRKLKVSELNRILPMVRETIEKERHINQIKNELNEKIYLLEKVHESIIHLNELPSLLSNITEQQKNQFQILKESQKKEKEKLELSITSLNEELEEATAQWKFETTLYKAITSAIVSEQDGFLLKTAYHSVFALIFLNNNEMSF